MPLDRDAWLAARRQGVTASDVGPILGLSPYKSPFDVYAEKVGLVADKDATEQMEFGKDIEQIVARKWSKRFGLEHRWIDELCVGPEAWMLATPDADVPPDDGLEIKSTGWKSENSGWGEPGTDQVPDWVSTQVHWQALVKNWNKVHIALYLTGPRKLESFIVYPDKDVQAHLVERCRQFWFNHVLPQEAPPLDWGGAADFYLKVRFPFSRVEPREATEEEGKLALEYGRVSAELKELEKQKHTIGNLLKEKIGESRGIAGPGFKASWYNTPESTYTVHRSPGRSLRVSGSLFRNLDE